MHYVAEGGGRLEIPLILVFVSLAVLFLGIAVHVPGASMAAWLGQRRRF